MGSWSSKAYVMQLAEDLHISPTFILDALTAYHSHHEDDNFVKQALRSPHVPKLEEQIKDLLEGQIVRTKW